MSKIKETIINTTNHDGEVLDTEYSIETINNYQEPPFVKTYISDIMRLNSLPNFTCKVVNEIISIMKYDNTFHAHAPVKRELCSKLNISINAVNKAITQLTDTGILIRKDRGLYIVDPNLFAKGSWKDIRALRLTIEYDMNGNKTMKASTIKNNIGDEFAKMEAEYNQKQINFNN